MFLLIFLSTSPLDQTAIYFWEFHPSSVILGIFVFFLIFCESLALRAKSRALIYIHTETFNVTITSKLIITC